MTKADVEKERVCCNAIKDMSFKECWMSLDPSDTVMVRYPHGRDGNAGRTSNSSKTSLMEDFLSFVDINSKPNGRSVDSSGPFTS